MANPENKQIPYESTQKDIRDAIESVATAIGGIAIPSANHVSYDNSGSGLSATDVQNALDEIVSDIPTVNDGTLTIQQNGETKGTFTANQSGNSTVNIETPTADIQTAVDEFETYNGGLLSECKVSFSPIQDLHGYSEPWVGGAGKNKLPNTVASITKDGVTFTVHSDGTVTVNGTATNITSVAYETITLNGTYILNGCPSGGGSGTYELQAVTTTTSRDYGNGVTFTVNGGCLVQILIRQGVTLNNVVFKPMIRLATESDPTFAPYSNICPISGHTQVDVDVSDGQTTQEQVTVNLGGTYYSGTLDVVSGVFVATHKSIGASDFDTFVTNPSAGGLYYAQIDTSGSKANGNGICNMAKVDNQNAWLYTYPVAQIAPSQAGRIRFYCESTSMNEFLSQYANLQIVFELDTPLTIQLTPTMVKALVGENHLSAPLDGQEITESEYRELFTWDEVEAYVNAHSGGGGGVDYSTTEVDTGIKWIDGKPIYMRTFTNVGLPQNSYSATLDLGVEADTIVKIEANDSANAGNATIIFEGIYAKINKTAGSNTILNPTNQLAHLSGATLTVYYTKATD